MIIETERDLEAMRAIGRIVASCLKFMGSKIEPGMTTSELDDIGRAFLAERGARSAPEVVYNFPGATCISVNFEAAHGVPGSKKIKAGDMVNIDVSAELNGYFADTGGSFIVPPSDALKEKLCRATREALEQALEVAKAGAPVNGIGKAIESVAKKHKLTIIKNLGSHGVGRALHEEPTFIPGYYEKKERRTLQEGSVITIEPFLANGATYVEENGDGWTLETTPLSLSAQYEHTLVITKNKPIILTIAD